MIYHPSSTRAINNFAWSVRHLFQKPRETFNFISNYFNLSSNLLFCLILIQLIGYSSKLFVLSYSLSSLSFLILGLILYSKNPILSILVSLIFLSKWPHLPIDLTFIISRFLSLYLIKNIFEILRIRIISQYFIDMNGQNIIQKYSEMIVIKIFTLLNVIFIGVTKFRFIIFYFQIVHVIARTTAYSRIVILRKGFKIVLVFNSAHSLFENCFCRKNLATGKDKTI